LVWDDPKGDDYPYQTEFSYRMNHVSRRTWFTYNIIGGALLGVIMAVLLYLAGDFFLSDMARTVVAALIGIWCTGFVEKTAERTTRVAQLAMVVSFVICTVIYSVSLI